MNKLCGQFADRKSIDSTTSFGKLPLSHQWRIFDLKGFWALRYNHDKL